MMHTLKQLQFLHFFQKNIYPIFLEKRHIFNNSFRRHKNTFFYIKPVITTVLINKVSKIAKYNSNLNTILNRNVDNNNLIQYFFHICLSFLSINLLNKLKTIQSIIFICNTSYTYIMPVFRPFFIFSLFF